MQTVYMDNASTSFPKAPGVARAMTRYLEEVGANVARGGYSPARSAGEEVFALREALCGLYRSDCLEGCILTSGATYGLNMVLKGLLRPGDHVLVSSLEHNAVMRPLRQLDGVTVDAIPCDGEGSLALSALPALFRPSTRLVCLTHASNVCGAVQPIGDVGRLCRERGVFFVVDASQTAGHLPVDCREDHIDSLLFSAHKGLLGPQGIGAALCTRRLAEALAPFVTGGTGSRSDQEIQPSFLPDKLEAGTPNLPGIYGFLAAVRYFQTHQEEIFQRQRRVTQRFLNGLRGLPLLGPKDAERRVPVFSVDFPGKDNGEIAHRLEREFGIFTRSGLHCAPAAHKALGTFPSGTVRFSPGFQTTDQEIDLCLNAIRTLLA